MDNVFEIYLKYIFIVFVNIFYFENIRSLAPQTESAPEENSAAC